MPRASRKSYFFKLSFEHEEDHLDMSTCGVGRMEERGNRNVFRKKTQQGRGTAL